MTPLKRPAAVWRFLLIPLSLSIVAPLAEAADVFSWRDGNGVVQYSDRAPLGAASRQLRVGTYARSDAQSSRLDEQKAVLNTERATNPSGHKTVATRGEQNCAAARERMQTLESGMRLARLGPEGQQVVITDEERQRDIAETRKNLLDWCGAR